MLKIGIIGCGKIAEKHIGGYQKIGNIEIYVTDVNSENKIIADKLGVHWVDNAMQLFQDDSITVIDVCTPTPFHFDLITQALESHKHVISEKPVVTTYEEASAIETLAKRMNRFVFAAYLYRFHPGFAMVKQVLDENIIGEPYYASFRLGGRGSHRAWKHQKGSGGGAINEMLVHMLDLVQWYFKDIEQADNLITETVLNKRDIEGKAEAANAEDFVLLNLQAKNGARILCQSDLITPAYMNYIEIHGTNGSVFTSILNTFPSIIFCHEARGGYHTGQNLLNFEQVDLFERELGYYLNCIKTNTKPGINGIEDSVAIAKLIESTFQEK